MDKKRLVYIVTSLFLIVGMATTVFLAGCGDSGTKPEASTASSEQPSGSTATLGGNETIRIGWVGNLSNPLGLGDSKVLTAMADVYNQSGGLDIGGKKYNVEFVMYDSKGDASTATAAVNRLVFQDKVKYVLGDDTCDAWIPITEANKVLAFVYTPSPAALDAKLKYTFQTSFLNTQLAVNWMWFFGKYPDVKTVGGLFVDQVGGRNDVAQIEKVLGPSGVELVDHAFFPADTQDFGALATRITKANPEVYTSSGVGPIPIELSWKAMVEAGYKGMLFSYRPQVPEVWESIAPLSLLEGQIFVLSTIDAARLGGVPMSGVAKEVYDGYTTKYGSWDFPFTDFSGSWFCLKAGMEKAQSLDAEKIAAAIGSGVEFDSPFGPAEMIKRPDLNNPRMVDTVYGTSFATVENGKVKVVDTITGAQAMEYLTSSGVYGDVAK